MLVCNYLTWNSKENDWKWHSIPLFPCTCLVFTYSHTLIPRSLLRGHLVNHRHKTWSVQCGVHVWRGISYMMISTFSALYCPKINNVNDSYIWVNLRTSCILPIFCILKKETFIMSYYLTHTSIWVLLFGWTSSSVAIPLLYLVVGRLFLNHGSGFGVKHSSGSGILSVGSSYRRALSTLMSPGFEPLWHSSSVSYHEIHSSKTDSLPLNYFMSQWSVPRK